MKSFHKLEKDLKNIDRLSTVMLSNIYLIRGNRPNKIKSNISTTTNHVNSISTIYKIFTIDVNCIFNKLFILKSRDVIRSIL